MPSVKMTKLFNYTPEELYALAIDVEHYPSFLPGCQSIRVFNRREGSFDADMVIGYKNFREKFTTRVTFEANKFVKVTYLSGPMKHLRSDWSFTPLGAGTEVQFDIDLELKSFILNKMLNGAFDKAVGAMVSAFRQRAKQVYGR